MHQLAVKNQTNDSLAVRKPRTASPLSLLSRHISPRPLFSPVVQKKSAYVCGGGCPRCLSKLPVQTKLAASQPGDMHEREADRVADQVMRTAEPTAQTTRGFAGYHSSNGCEDDEADESVNVP